MLILSSDLYKIYILPVLTYGLEVILPKKTLIDKLELFQKRLIKQILTLPNHTSDIALYVLTGILPIEAQIHIKALTLFNNIALQEDKAVEK